MWLVGGGAGRIKQKGLVLPGRALAGQHMKGKDRENVRHCLPSFEPHISTFVVLIQSADKVLSRRRRLWLYGGSKPN